MTDDADHSARVQGLQYGAFLANLHATLEPENYLEIGTDAGNTLALAGAAAIAVDPHFRIEGNVVGAKPSCLMFQQTSDAFFAEHNPRALFGAPIDVAFLDGMHVFEYLLRDIINTEKHCRRNSIVLLHDCLPPGFYMTTRDAGDPIRSQSRFKDWWTGDVWKVLPVLQQYRPDLSVTLLDCAPTGLIAITDLDPNNTTLRDHYNEIVASHAPHTDRESYDAFWRNAAVVSAATLASEEQLRVKFNRGEPRPVAPAHPPQPGAPRLG